MNERVNGAWDIWHSLPYIWSLYGVQIFTLPVLGSPGRAIPLAYLQERLLWT